MIERDTTANLAGQMDLGDLMPKGTGMAEGYDDTGNLINPTDPITANDAALKSYTTPTPEAQRLERLAGEINAITNHARVVLATAAIDVGKRLIEARGLVPDGRWLEWLRDNVDYSDRQAQVLMQIAEQYGRGELPEAYRGLGISHLTALLSAPEDAREDMARRASDEGLSVRALKDEIKVLRNEAEDRQTQLDILVDKSRKDEQTIMRQESDFEEYRERMEDELKAAKNVIAQSAEKVSLAQAKAESAEASAEELRKLHSDAEDRAAASAQRASDAVARANRTAKDLAEARAKIAALEEANAAAANSPEVQTVEVVPEALTRELEALRAEVARLQKPSPGGEGGARSATDDAPSTTATDRFKRFYDATMKPAFTQALDLLRDVAREDPHAADVYATALTRGCKMLMDQLGTKEE